MDTQYRVDGRRQGQPCDRAEPGSAASGSKDHRPEAAAAAAAGGAGRGAAMSAHAGSLGGGADRFRRRLVARPDDERHHQLIGAVHPRHGLHVAQPHGDGLARHEVGHLPTVKTFGRCCVSRAALRPSPLANSKSRRASFFFTASTASAPISMRIAWGPPPRPAAGTGRWRSSGRSPD